MLTFKTAGFVKVSAFIFLLAFAASCKKESSGPVALDSAKKQTIKNVMYGSDTAEKMDVYLPAGRTTSSTKVFVLMHPGSWDEGDKTDFNAAVDTLRILLPDYAFFNINYRLANKGVNIFPAAINDVALAIQFINANAATYTVDTQKLVLGGASAGAHLALLQAYSVANTHLKAVVDLFGPPDLAWLYTNHPFPQFARPVLENFLGATLAQNAALYAAASPINYVSASSAPTIIFHGKLDDVVPIEESEQLQAKLNAFSITNSLVVYDNEGHGWVGKHLTDTYLKIASFLKQHVE